MVMKISKALFFLHTKINCDKHRKTAGSPERLIPNSRDGSQICPYLGNNTQLKFSPKEILDTACKLLQEIACRSFSNYRLSINHLASQKWCQTYSNIISNDVNSILDIFRHFSLILVQEKWTFHLPKLI